MKTVEYREPRQARDNLPNKTDGSVYQDLCQQLGKNGKQTVHQEFGISRTAKNMLAVFRDYVSS